MDRQVERKISGLPQSQIGAESHANEDVRLQ